MKATQLIRTQHQEVKDLDRRLSVASGDEEEEIGRELTDIIQAHSRMEEELLYPRFADEEGFEEIVARSLREHQQADQLVIALQRTESGTDEWRTTTRRLINLFLQHVDFEERELLPKIDLTLGDDELEDLGSELEQRFDEIMRGEGEEARV
jgi:hemerythrin-like domain-containing protein